ncbi:YrhB domain-containing protein [Streptacidiphilus sp. MAP5-3]|uniref:YrhB domain-containing protein n=1 Tax=unclassified Streptacidiphilus TaxID=2643834 RepID=UPI0035138CE9
MNRDEAIEAVRAFLKKEYPSAPPTIVLRAEWTREHAWAWRVAFDVQEYLETGDEYHRPMSRALYVRKDTGAVDYLPDAMPSLVADRYLETGVWPYGPGAGR